ncbi:alpha-hydroxy acid oxidase [Achromobacter animicus]|uniref:alpha-hydroxy acid oxidase n=1 Tax=Achromobacter animicus TaxID=1389935 RepID=UPI002447186C|nr:alpha-hydroxy acid oxidase [Achromobacter animicus]MDH0683064.1 alpha-hydroxy-acid oxidizing protein [Achromobacter animicus]
MKNIYSLDDFERYAQRRLPSQLFSYITNGAEDEKTLRGNRSAFDRLALLPRVLRDVSTRTQQISLFGQRFSSPVGIAPVGMAAMWHYRADLDLATAAAKSEIPAIMSGASLVPMEDVAKAAPKTWFQAYLPASANDTEALVHRVAAAGFQTLVVTVDLPVTVNPERYLRNGFSNPLRPNLKLFWEGVSHPIWLTRVLMRTIASHGLPRFENLGSSRGASILTTKPVNNFINRDFFSWEHAKLIRRLWTGNLVIKGVLRPDDAVTARDLGFDGVIVSSHGGRQLDSAIPPLLVLQDVVKAVPDMAVMMDSGVRRGSDALKALALGAKCVFIGRPFHYAAAYAGRQGVDRAIKIIQSEIHRNMAFLGINTIDEMDSSLIRDLGVYRLS